MHDVKLETIKLIYTIFLGDKYIHHARISPTVIIILLLWLCVEIHEANLRQGRIH